MKAPRRAAAAPMCLVVCVLGCASSTRYLDAPLELGPSDARRPTEAVRITPATPAEPVTLVGRWSGTGTQDDGQSWPIVVDVLSSAAGRCATARYPSIPCTADWFCTGTEGDVVLAKEKLRTGAGKCIDNGEMRMQLVDGTLEWSWRGDGQTANAVLHKEDRATR